MMNSQYTVHSADSKPHSIATAPALTQAATITFRPLWRLSLASLDRERSGLLELYRTSTNEALRRRALGRVAALNNERTRRHNHQRGIKHV